jgi:hypothetical protein
MNNTKILLFARWISTCYADTHLDSEKRCEHDKDFESTDASYLKNETVINMERFLNHNKTFTLDFIIKELENCENRTDAINRFKSQL